MIDLTAIWDQFDQLTTRPEEEQSFREDPWLCSCGGRKQIESGGLHVCTECATVTDVIDESAEWISGEDGIDQSRCGAPQDKELFSGSWGMGTTMTRFKPTHLNKKLALMNFHGSMNHRDRSLFHAYKGMDEICKLQLHLDDQTIRDAKLLYRMFADQKLTRGAIRTGVKANCVLYSCKMKNIPRTTREIATAFNIPTKDISRTAELFKTVSRKQKKDEPTKITKPCSVIVRLLNDFHCVDGKTKMQCVKMAEKLENCVELMGKTPTSIASVVIMKQLKVSKGEVVAKCGISMPTLNKIDNIVSKYLES